MQLAESHAPNIHEISLVTMRALSEFTDKYQKRSQSLNLSFASPSGSCGQESVFEPLNEVSLPQFASDLCLQTSPL